MPSMLLENDFMFSGNSVVPWHGIGAVLDGVPNSEEAIKAAKLDWMVEQVPVYSQKDWSVPIPSYVANVRSDTNEVLGIVSDRYCVAQNKDVFAFADALISSNKTKYTFETAGSLYNGRRVFMLVNMPKGRIVEDEYRPFLCLSNAHDGSACLQIFLTGVRICCANSLTMALTSAKRKISIRHLSLMEQRKEEAVMAMGAASKYFHELEAFATQLAGKKVKIGKVLDLLFPVSSEMSSRQVKSNNEVKQFIKNLFKKKDDLQNFRGAGSAWGVYSAIADYRSNAEPKRKTSTYADSKMARFIDGDPIMNQAQDIIMELAA